MAVCQPLHRYVHFDISEILYDVRSYGRHTLRFDLSLACAVSKRKVIWSVCGIKTTDLVSLYRLRLGLKEICRRLIFLCVYRQVSEQI